MAESVYGIEHTLSRASRDMKAVVPTSRVPADWVIYQEYLAGLEEQGD